MGKSSAFCFEGLAVKDKKLLWGDGGGSNTIMIRLHFTFSVYFDHYVRYNY